MASKDQDAAIIAVIGMLSGMSPNCANVVHTAQNVAIPTQAQTTQAAICVHSILPPKDGLGEDCNTLPQAAKIQSVPEAPQ